MEEIFPIIENKWSNFFQKNSIAVKKIDLESFELKKEMADILRADYFLFICFNENIAKLMKLIRSTLNPDAKFILYLHGLATVGLWPLQEFKVLDLMTTNDLFIGTCEGDKHCLELISLNINSAIIPFESPNCVSAESESLTKEINKIAYIGRLSDQKNVDLLISAYALARSSKRDLPNLDIYGEEDFLGSPNMNIPSSNFLEKIKVQVKELKMEDKIIFHGYVKRDELFSLINSSTLVISLSTHSDENFGMALYRALSLKANAIATHWGGHVELCKLFPNQVKLIPVNFDNGRPVPDIKKAASSLCELSTFSKSLHEKSFLNIDISEELLNSTEKRKIEISDLGSRLFNQRESYKKSGERQQVFTSYHDPIANQFLRAYSK